MTDDDVNAVVDRLLDYWEGPATDDVDLDRLGVLLVQLARARRRVE